MARTCLIAIANGQFTSAADANNILDTARHAHSLLRLMGYQVDWTVFDVSTGSTHGNSYKTASGGYEFVICIRLNTPVVTARGFQTFLDGTSVIPTFMLYAGESGGTLYNTYLGVDRAVAAGYFYATVGGVSCPLFAAQMTQHAGGNTVTPLLSVDATSNFWMWKVNGKVYCTSSTSGGHALPLLMQFAINDGAIAKPDNRAKFFLDLDELPKPLTNLADAQAVYALQEKYGIPATWSINATAITSVTADVRAYIKSMAADKGGLIYLIDHHSGAGDDWRGAAATVDAFYRQAGGFIPNMQAAGIKTGTDAPGLNSFGYRYFNANQIGEGGAQVMGWMDPANKAANGLGNAPYGHKAFRNTQGIADGVTKQVRPSIKDSSISTHRGMRNLGGYSFMASSNLNLDPTTNISTFATQLLTGFFYDCLSFTMPMFMHGENFYSGHDGGNAPGLLSLAHIGACLSLCKNTVVASHPGLLSASEM